MLKQSYYNHFTLYGDMAILYNFLYKNIIILSKDEYERIYPILSGQNVLPINLLKKDEYDLLRSKMFLIDNDFDELEYFKYNYFKSLYSNNTFRNTILPTLECNLRCPYCYEEKRNCSMSEETIDAYLEWIEPFLSEVKYFSVEWFGGEPLLEIQTIEKISNGIEKLQRKYGFAYNANITTNGVLLNEEYIKRIEKCHINSVQICFDGDKDWHDKYRISASGKGSFDTIMNNIETYCKESQSNSALAIRINVTDDNYNGIDGLLDRLDDSIKKRAYLFFRWIYESRAQNFRPFSNQLRGSLPFENISKLYNKAKEKGFYTNNLDESVSYNFCECDFANKYRIGPDGSIFLCTQSYNDVEAIGNVKSGIRIEDISMYYRFININPFSDEECIECKYLPLCKGGCRKAVLHGKKSCFNQKNSIDDYVMMLYNKHNII